MDATNTSCGAGEISLNNLNGIACATLFLNETDGNATLTEQYGIDIVGYIGTSLGSLAVVLNLLFLICACCVKDRDSAHNRFIQNMSVCDILGSITFIITQNWPEGPFAKILEDQPLSNVWRQGLPYVFRSLPWMFFTAYMLTLNCLSVSQYLASCKPHIYMRMNVHFIMRIKLAVVWIFASLQIAIPVCVLASLSGRPDALQRLVFISKIEMVLWMVIYTSSTCLSIILSILVYCKLRKTANNVTKQDNLSQTSSVTYRPVQTGANSKVRHEAVITVSCLCVASILFRLPLPLVGMLLITVIERNFGPAAVSWTLAVVVLLLYSVFVVDPVIYFVRMPEVRETMCRLLQQLLKRIHRRQNNSSESLSYQEVDTNLHCTEHIKMVNVETNTV